MPGHLHAAEPIWSRILVVLSCIEKEEIEAFAEAVLTFECQRSAKAEPWRRRCQALVAQMQAEDDSDMPYVLQARKEAERALEREGVNRQSPTGLVLVQHAGFAAASNFDRFRRDPVRVHLLSVAWRRGMEAILRLDREHATHSAGA